MAHHPDYRTYAARIAKRYGLNPKIFIRQIEAESGFNPHAGSSAGAIGIAQFMPGTAKSMGVNPNDPYSSLAGAARMMAQSVKKYGSYEKALRAYNAGDGAVQASYGYGETNAYVKKILGGIGDPGKLGKTTKKGSGGGGGDRTVTTTTPGALEETQTLDQAGLDQARGLQMLSQKIANDQSGGGVLESLTGGQKKVKSPLDGGGYSALFKSGVLSTATPDPANFVKTDLTRGPDVVRTTKVKGGGGAGLPTGVKDGGGYNGTQKVAETAGRGFITSGKRTPAQNAAVGGASGSDHLTTNKNAYAVDMGASGAAGDKIFRTVAKRFGINASPGSYDRHIVKINGKKYSIQLLWKVKGHYDHVHLGVQRV